MFKCGKSSWHDIWFLTTAWIMIIIATLYVGISFKIVIPLTIFLLSWWLFDLFKRKIINDTTNTKTN